ncbi:MAG: DUF721 domain-containing protein [Methylococcaceae bacterium]|nr:DUF721 domain-containing protein [Methylococcaceae bacterium]
MPQKPPTFKPSAAFYNRTMGYFYSQIDQQQRLLQRVRAVLPDTLAAHAQHCLVRDHTLLVYTPSAVWATQLRFYKTALLGAVSNWAKTPIEQVQIKLITRQVGLADGYARAAKIPSAQLIERIRQDNLAADDELGLALLKLSQTLGKLSAKT